MGTFAKISLLERNKGQITSLFKMIDQMEALLSSYKPNSEISILNRKGQATISPITYELLKRSQELYVLSGGLFDITIGALTGDHLNLGHPKRSYYGSKPLPLKTALTRVDIRHLDLEPTRARLLHQARIDLGGIGKGYTLDQLAKHLHRKGVKTGILSLSGDIRCLHRVCPIQVRDPFSKDPQQSIAEFKTKTVNLSISTSGSYEQRVKNSTTHHLIHPKTGASPQQVVSLTLTCPGDNTTCDAMATALFLHEDISMIFSLAKRLKLGSLAITRDKKAYFNTRFAQATSDLHWKSGSEHLKIIRLE